MTAVSSAFATPPAVLEPFALREVRLLDGPFKHAETVNRAYLLSLDPDRLLYHFRHNAGLPTHTQPYGGWENSDWAFHGHTLGHYLSACSLMAAHGDEPEFSRRVAYIVDQLGQCQDTLAVKGSHAGFLDPLPEAAFDRLDRGEGNVGVPYYTMHKTLAGLLDAYDLAGNAQALIVARRLGDWLVFRAGRLTTEQLQHALRIEYGGINESLAELAAVTGNDAYERTAEAFNHRLLFEPLSRGLDPLGPPTSDPLVPGGLLHGNTQVPKMLGAAREYELTGNPVLRTIAVNFWESVVRHRTWVFGGNTDREHFFARGTEAHHLTEATGEGCNTYNMLKLTRHLFAWAPAADQMDFYERALYNHILATQRPDDGRMIYFMAMEPGFRKLYGTAENTFWCCTGSGMENHTKYADTIYFHDANALYVNLFIPSELHWRERSLTVRQETNFPGDDRSTLTIHTPHAQRLALRIRHPGWCDRLEVTVNGEPQPSDLTPGSYVTIEREWRDADRIELRLPMHLHLEPLPGDPAQVAFLFGPIVLAGKLGREGLQFKPAEYADNGKDPRGPRLPESPVPVPCLVTTAHDVLTHITAVAGKPLTFVTTGIGRPNDVTMVPLNQIVDENYTVYWRLFDEAGWSRYSAETAARDAQQRARQARIVDAVWSGSTAMEASHEVGASAAPLVSSQMNLYHDATHGRLTWKLQTANGAARELRIGFLGGEAAAFDVTIDGTLLTRIMARDGAVPATPVTTIRSYAVAPALVAGKSTVEVGFTGRGDAGPAQIVFCELLRATR